MQLDTITRQCIVDHINAQSDFIYRRVTEIVERFQDNIQIDEWGIAFAVGDTLSGEFKPYVKGLEYPADILWIEESVGYVTVMVTSASDLLETLTQAGSIWYLDHHLHFPDDPEPTYLRLPLNLATSVVMGHSKTGQCWATEIQVHPGLPLDPVTDDILDLEWIVAVTELDDNTPRVVH